MLKTIQVYFTATGNSSGGRYALQYNFWMAGNSIGMAITLGRIVGKHMAGLKY